jgi:uncharacterized protein (DUF1330 family)
MKIYLLIMIDDIDFEQYKKYKEYIQNEMLKLCGKPKNLYEKTKKL